MTRPSDNWDEGVGRSGSDEPSGSRPTDGAASVSTADAASIPNAVELQIANYLSELAKASKNSGSDFNQGVVRGLEIAAAQFEHGHAKGYVPALSTLPAGETSCSEDMIEAANASIQTMFAETAILLTHPDPSRQAVAKERVFAILFGARGEQ